MREAAEIADDVAVDLGVLHAVGIIGGGAERDAALLILQSFGMHEGHVEEALFRRLIGFVEPPGDRAFGDFNRLRICGEGAGAAAKHVARELVEQDQQRIDAFRGFLPIDELSGRRGLMDREEVPADLRVEGVVLGEPFLWAGLAPEADDGIGAGQGHEWLRSSKSDGSEIILPRPSASRE